MTVPEEKIEFLRTIEGLFIKGLGGDTDEGLKAKLRAAGLDLDRPLLPGYPAEQFHRWIQIAAGHVHPKLPLEESVRLIGQRSVPALEDSLIGRALASGLKIIGPRRTLERAERVFRNNSNYQEVKVLAITQNSARMGMAYVFGVPWYYQGVFEQALSIIGAKNVTVSVALSPPPGAIYDIKWD